MSDTRFPWRTTLFVSVALNLLIIGGVVGAWGAGVRLQREADSRAIVERMPGVRAFLLALPPETRAVMREEMAASWGESRAARQAASQARRDAFVAAATEPYDAARVREAFERLRAADQAAVAIFHNNVVDGFAELTPEERREALEALRTAPPATRPADRAGDGAGRVRPERSPEQRQAIEERRAERRERWRQRRQERQQQQQRQP